MKVELMALAGTLATCAVALRKMAEKAHQWEGFIEELMEEQRQKRDKACPHCKRKPLKKMVGAPGIEPGTTTMSNKRSQGKKRVLAKRKRTKRNVRTTS
jgi:hypothetical protein